MFENFKIVRKIKKLKNVPVRNEFLMSLRHRLENEIRYSSFVSEAKYFVFSPFKYAFTFAIIILFVFGTSSFVFAAESLPGDTLYPIKLLKEDVQDSLIMNSENKIVFNERRINDRFREMEKLLGKGKDGEILISLEQNIEKYFDKILEIEFKDIEKDLSTDLTSI